MKFIISLMLIISVNSILAQSFSGKVIDQYTNEGIPLASVYLVNLEIGAKCDVNGFFSIDGNFSDSVLVRISSSGYAAVYKTVFVDTNLQFVLTETHLKLQEATVSSSVSNVQRDNVVFIDSKSIKELNYIKGTMGEAIANISGVYNASSGPGISKPVIRGMQGVRLVTMLNGQRVENQQWGGDHGMAITSLGIGSVEVVKGPASLMYGADALGGVLYFVDEPYVKQNTQHIEITSRFETASLGSSTSGQYQFAKKNIRMNLAGMVNDYADYRLPNNHFAQNTRFKEYAGKFAFGWNRKKWVMNVRYNGSRNRVGIPGGSHEEEGEEEEEEEHHDEFQSELQEREIETPSQLIDNHLLSLSNKWIVKNGIIDLLVGHGINRLRELEESLDTAALDMLIHTTNYHLKGKWRFGNHWNLIVGTQGGYQINRNSKNAEERLIPDFEQVDHGAYGILFWKLNSWRFQGGARLDHRGLFVADFQNSSSFTRSYFSANGSIGGVYTDDLNVVRANISTGFRAPHVSELSADGEHHGALRYELGNQNLVSERATQFDVVYELSQEHLEVIVNPFFNYVQNYIYLAPSDSTIEDLSVFNYEQKDAVFLYGGDIGVHYHPHFAHWMHVESSYSFVRAEDGNETYLTLIPQSRINTTLRFTLEKMFKNKFKIESINIQYNYNFDQNKVSGLETISPSYSLINIGVDFKLDWKMPLEISVGVKNVLNESYIDHLSRLKNIGMQHSGRNVYLSLNYEIDWKKKDSVKR